MTDYFDVTWSPTRAAAIVRPTGGEIPPDECDEAAHQLLACGNLARRINTPPALRTRGACDSCTHSPEGHRGTVGDGDPLTHCRVAGCPCVGYVEP